MNIDNWKSINSWSMPSSSKLADLHWLFFFPEFCLCFSSVAVRSQTLVSGMMNVRLGQGMKLICILLPLLLVKKTEGLAEAPLIFMQSAVAKGAVCLDGSPPAYQFDKGVGDGVNNYLIHLQGGGWCESTKSCLLRTNMSNGVGSSKLMTAFNLTGVFSNKQLFNPNFYNWNRIIVRYCDGASFTGDVEEVDPATNLHYRGARIFNVVMDELLAKGMKNASNALLTGCSSGGLSALIYCDKFRALLPPTAKVRCAPDAGYFSHVKDISGRYHFAKFFSRIVKLHKSEEKLPSACTSKMKPGLCFYPQYFLPYIKTPVFIINSAFDGYQINNILTPKKADKHGAWIDCKANITKCSPAQIKTLQDFRSNFLNALTTGLGKSSSNGWFINSCYAHCQTGNQITWIGDPASMLNNKAIAEAVGDWFYDRSKFQVIDPINMPRVCGIVPPPKVT